MIHRSLRTRISSAHGSLDLEESVRISGTENPARRVYRSPGRCVTLTKLPYEAQQMMQIFLVIVVVLETHPE